MMNRKMQKFLGILMVMVSISPVLASDNRSSSAGTEILSLEQCLDIALQNSQEIQAAVQNVAIAQAQVRQAEGGVRPILGYEITGSDSDKDQVADVTPSKQTSTAGISLTQPLYSGGQLTRRVKLARLNLEAAGEDARKTRQTLIYHVTAAYYQVWLAQQKVKVAEASYDNLGRHARQVELFYQVGKASKFDLLRAQVEHENLKPAVIKAQNEVILAKLNLTTLTGLEKRRVYIVDYDVSQLRLQEEIVPDLQAVLGKAYQNRPELKKYEKLQAIAGLQTEMADAGYKPAMALTASYQGTSIGKIDPGAWGDHTRWTLMLNIKGNFCDGGVTSAKVEEAKANERLVTINESKWRDAIYLEIEQSLQGLKENLEVVHANQANMNLAEKTLKMTQVKFESGMATTMDVRDTQLALDQALNGYYEGISAYLIALAKLDLASGACRRDGSLDTKDERQK
jgi:outer membrane protein